MTSDIAAIDFTLRARKINRVPDWLGRAAQALIYEALHTIHPMVSETVHDLHKWQPRMAKPFTVSNLSGAPAPDDLMHLHPDQSLRLRLTTLHPHMTGISLNGVVPLLQRHGICLHDQPFWIRHTRKERTTYDDLLNYAGDADEIVFEFTSPTAFKQTGGGYLSDPSPRYILSSLYNRWNSFTDFSLPTSLHDVIQNQLRLIDADVQRRTLSFARGRKGNIPGFYGTVRIGIQETSTEARRILNALADFAPFSGVGIKTTVGMGQVKKDD